MKRPARPLIVTALTLAVATPALATPNAFWTFGWDFPGRGKPWAIASNRAKAGPIQTVVAARPPQVEQPVELGFVLPFDMDGLTEPTTATY